MRGTKRTEERGCSIERGESVRREGGGGERKEKEGGVRTKESRRDRMKGFGERKGRQNEKMEETKER